MQTPRLKLEFPGTNGLKIAALLDLPKKAPHAFMLFAHCFTCGKDMLAASRIARALASYDYAVLRFDFTGLGDSEGKFENSNFSSNVNDLIHAADFLRVYYRAPVVLIGHSLGGAAVLSAARSIPEVAGVVTIAAPADPNHVIKQFASDVERIRTHGIADVKLAGRSFTIKKQFLDDLAGQQLKDEIAKLRKPLLIFHSPMDTSVSIEEAEKIYRAAMHPKSFISLKNADHLLTKVEDAEYVAVTIAAWATRFASDTRAPTSVWFRSAF